MNPQTTSRYRQEDGSSPVSGSSYASNSQNPNRNSNQDAGLPQNIPRTNGVKRLHQGPDIVTQDGIVLDAKLINGASKLTGKVGDVGKSMGESATATFGAGLKQVNNAFQEFIKPGPVKASTAKARIIALWAALIGAGIFSLKSIIDLASYPFNRSKKKVAFIWKALEAGLGATVCKGIYDTISNNGGKAFNKMSTILFGLGGFGLLKLFNGCNEGNSNVLSKAINLVPDAKNIVQNLNDGAKFAPDKAAMVPNTVGNFG